ncbi:MAG: tRNA pseudouridine synthase A, partial [Deltaproteobacteria bacterium]|nr:tRNA pseudouridine synthase A [Deltaproteobacteria bacterium]
MAKIKLTLEYDGTNYVGWQVQPNGVSVQQRVELALKQLLGEPVRVHSSGRTDAGVHALGMVCHLVTSRELPLSAWRDGVNRYLPDSIAVRAA